MNRNQGFIKALAVLLVKNQEGKGIALLMPDGVVPWAREWAALRQNTFLQGSPTLEEAEKALSEQLGINMEGA